MNYKKKIIIITGAYRGIGYALSNYFAAQGASLIITYHCHKEETLKLQEELISKYHVHVDAIHLDLCQEKSITYMSNCVKGKYGKVDILVNNAAVSRDSDIDDKTKDEFMNVLEVNVVGTFLMMKHFDKIVDGYIFNMSSTDGIDTGNIYSIDYNASKAGVNSLTKTFSLYSKNTIISICPNWVDTESTREMDSNYLKNELKRIKQKKVIDVNLIPKLIDDCIEKKVCTGSIVRLDGEIDE